jgi:uncharacterized protein YcbK (DUF882 family)
LVRDVIGWEKLPLTSGYRSRAYNESIEGAATNSPHMGGIAVDIGVDPSDKDSVGLRKTLADLAYDFGFGGIATGYGFVHIDSGVQCLFPYDGTDYVWVPETEA